MKKFSLLGVILAALLFLILRQDAFQSSTGYDVYQYVQECKTELGITGKLPQLSCLDGNPVPIYVKSQKIDSDNWETIADSKRCDNPHWLGGDMGCWTYSHLQVQKLDDENILVLNCRQKGNQLKKDWFRETNANLGMNQQQRKWQYENAPDYGKDEFYYLYNTFNDIGLILRNTRTGKSCYLTQYGEAVVGFLPPLDEPLPEKRAFLDGFEPEQSRPPEDFPESLWYRDANQAFRSPTFTASAGCIDCHNPHGVKYSPYINSRHGLPDVYSMARLPFLPIGEPYKAHFRKKNMLQISTEAIDGEPQLCTQCHNITTSGICDFSIGLATGHPSKTLDTWLTASSKNRWMPPTDAKLDMVKKHVAAIRCCCQNPNAKGCRSRKFGPTEADLPEGFHEGKGWVKGQEAGLCESVIESPQWSGDKF